MKESNNVLPSNTLSSDMIFVLIWNFHSESTWLSRILKNCLLFAGSCFFGPKLVVLVPPTLAWGQLLRGWPTRNDGLAEETSSPLSASPCAWRSQSQATLLKPAYYIHHQTLDTRSLSTKLLGPLPMYFSLEQKTGLELLLSCGILGKPLTFSEADCLSLKWAGSWHFPPRALVRMRSKGCRAPDTWWLLSKGWLRHGGGWCQLLLIGSLLLSWWRPCPFLPLCYKASRTTSYFQTFQIYTDPRKQIQQAHKLIKKMNQIKGGRGS